MLPVPMHRSFAFFVAVFVAACGPPPQDAERPTTRGNLPDGGVTQAQAFAADRIARVPAGTFGPYVASTANGSVVAFAMLDGSTRNWYGVPIDRAGKPGTSVKLGPSPAEVGLAVLESNGADYTLLYTTKNGATTYVEALRLTASAQSVGRPMRIAEVKGDVIWIDVVATSRDALAAWAVRRDNGADVFASPVSETAKSTEVARAASAWQASSFGSSAAFAVVSGGDAEGGKVDVLSVEVTGKTAQKISVSASPTAEADLDMVESGNNLILAWTDRRDLDEHVYVAAIDASGKLIRPPAPGPAPLGEQALVRLVAPFAGRTDAFLAWEDLSERPDVGRAIRVARVDANGVLGSERTDVLHASAESVPELTASTNGLAALTLAPSCAKGSACEQAPLVATYVDLDRNLTVTLSEPLRVGVLGGEAPDLTWGLSCAASPCRALGAQATDPAPIYWVALEKSGAEWQPAARRVEPKGGAHPTRIRSLAKADPIADVSATRLQSSTLAAWVTDFDPNAPMERLTKPAPDGRFDPVRSTLAVRAIPDDKDPLEVQTLSIRARSLGGVSIRAGAGDSKEAMVVWTALDNKLPQVFVTVVDATGKKLRQRMVTRTPGEKTDVALSAIGDGWMLAWVDERSGDPEVYAVRLNKFLQSAGPEKRITNAPGSASDVSLFTRGNNVQIAWSDARVKERPGWASIYSATLNGADASLVGSEQAVSDGKQHAHSASFGALDKGGVLAWIESTPTALGGSSGSSARIAEVDDAGKVSGSAAIAVPRGAPTAIAVDCANGACRIGIGVAVGERAELDSCTFKSGATTVATRLVGLAGNASMPLAFDVLSDGVVTLDRNGDEGRVRQIAVDWAK
jgi:hypothetical protein